MSLVDVKRKELDSLPRREWDKESVYGSVMLLPSRKKHDSGWMVINIIGCRDGKPVEIATECCDDINWIYRASQDYRLRTDMAYPSGIAHMWGNDIQFRVKHSLSSTDIVIEDRQ